MKLQKYQTGILWTDAQDFDLKHIFECGQCFRWMPDGDGYTGVVGEHVLHVEKTEKGVLFDPCDMQTFEMLVIPYFDLSRDYAAVKKRIAKDDVIRRATAFGSGIRILKQDVWEMIISFILSQRCSIPKIQKVISLLCENFGKPLDDRGKRFYSFPKPEALADRPIEDLACLRCGYRDRYVLDAARKVVTGEVRLSALEELSYQEAMNELKKIMGIGDKVAQCILLFGLHKFEAFPVDTWVLKVMADRYHVAGKDIMNFVSGYFCQDSGFAQQYLFYCERENGFSA